MTYQVVVQPHALRDLEEAYRYAAKHAPATAARWYNRFHEALGTLSRNPERCPLAPENPRVRMEIREYLFGRKPNVYRAIYTVDAAVVRVLRIRRGSRRMLSQSELEDSIE